MSRSKDLHDILLAIKNFNHLSKETTAVSGLSSFSNHFGLGANLGHFIGVYYGMVDAAIDEVMDWHGFSVERRNKLVKKIQKSRNLIAFASVANWTDFRQQFTTGGHLDILELIDDALVAGGKVDTFIADDKDIYIEELSKIRNGIENSNLHAKIKVPILGHLDILISTFKKIDVTGQMDADSHLKIILAELVIHGDEIKSSDEEDQLALYPLMEFLKKHYPGVKWSADLLMTVANGGLLAVQSGAI